MALYFSDQLRGINDYIQPGTPDQEWSAIHHCRLRNFGLGPGAVVEPHANKYSHFVGRFQSRRTRGEGSRPTLWILWRFVRGLVSYFTFEWLFMCGHKSSLSESLETYGAIARQVKAPIGYGVRVQQLVEELKADKYKVVTITHVDTSTGVLSDIRSLAQAAKETSPDTLVRDHPGNILVFAADNGPQVIVDGVCSVASEEIKFDDWEIDVVLTASQKGIGVPPGLSLLCASERAIKVTSPWCQFGQLISDPGSLNRCSKNERLQ